MNNTSGSSYFEEIHRNSNVLWKKVLPTQLPYRLNLKTKLKGKTLEVGSGLGRNLRHLDSGSVGVDHNSLSVNYCNSLGLPAYLPQDFHEIFSPERQSFDNLLLSHVLEHVSSEEQESIFYEYLPYLAEKARIFIITPQEKGFYLTDSHINWTDFSKIEKLLGKVAPDFKISRMYSFPFPRFVGRIFNYNEFNVIANRS